MEFEEFKEKFKNHLSIINKTITDEQILKFYRYMELLMEWKNKLNSNNKSRRYHFKTFHRLINNWRIY